MKKIEIAILFVLLAGCGQDYTEIYTNPQTVDLGVFMDNEGAESTPVFWQDRVLIVTFHRPASGYYVTITDMNTSEVLAILNTPDFTTGCAYVENGRFYIYGTSGITVTGGAAFNNNTISVITSTDLRSWTAPHVLYRAADGTQAWNVSVTKTNGGYVMAYDYSEAPIETSPSQARFLYSQDLYNWQDMPGRLVGSNRYFAAVTLRYSNGMYYAMFVQSYKSRSGYYLPNIIARSADLHTWDYGRYAVMSPLGRPAYLNTSSDADMVEVNGKTLIVYLTGDQGGPAGTKMRIAEFPYGIDIFLASHF